jgi:rRNA maturation protein Nop10
MTAIRFALFAPLALTATLAHADSDRYTLSSAYVQECGACHSPYPPALLPKDSWQRLMGGLDKH